jgi:hypothetical protein
MGKVIQKFPFSNRAILLAAMDDKAARRGFTSWDDEDEVSDRVMPLVLGACPGTRDFWSEFRNLHLDTFEGFSPSGFGSPPF